MARAALVLDIGDIAEFATLAAEVRAAFRRTYVTPAGRVSGETATPTVTGYALAICFGILTPRQETYAGDRLAELVAKSGYRIPTGFAGTPYVAEALSRTGHLDDAYRLMLETEPPSFLYPVTMGATTIWERWDAVRPDHTLHPSSMNSLNHYALGAAADWLHRVVGGLAPTEPGYRTMRIAPKPGGGLTHATLTHDTAHGQVTVAWQITDGHLQLDVTVPDGATATVEPPLHPDGREECVAAGEHSWHYRLPDTVAP